MQGRYTLCARAHSGAVPARDREETWLLVPSTHAETWKRLLVPVDELRAMAGSLYAGMSEQRTRSRRSPRVWRPLEVATPAQPRSRRTRRGRCRWSPLRATPRPSPRPARLHGPDCFSDPCDERAEASASGQLDARIGVGSAEPAEEERDREDQQAIAWQAHETMPQAHRGTWPRSGEHGLHDQPDEGSLSVGDETMRWKRPRVRAYAPLRRAGKTRPVHTTRKDHAWRFLSRYSKRPPTRQPGS